MTRVMLDALYPHRIPVPQAPGVMIAAYVGHASNPQSLTEAIARFPGHEIVSIASYNAVNAQVLDVENGAVDPADRGTQRDWCGRQWARGVKPSVYVNTSTFPQVQSNLVGIEFNWWAANWSHGPNIPTVNGVRACGCQWDGTAGYDQSIMDDYIEGIDAVDAPSVSDIWADAIPVPTIWNPNGATVGGVNYPPGSMPAWWVMQQVLSISTASLVKAGTQTPINLADLETSVGGDYTLTPVTLDQHLAMSQPNTP